MEIKTEVGIKFAIVDDISESDTDALLHYPQNVNKRIQLAEDFPFMNKEKILDKGKVDNFILTFIGI